jgi:hypothetical protein
MKIVAFGHERGVGKDTAAGFLVMHLRRLSRNKNVCKASMAYAAKLEVCKRYPLVREPEFYDTYREMKDMKIPEYGASARELWIKVSNEVMEEKPKYFLDLVINENRSADFLIITDLRYLHMAGDLVDRNGLAIKIERDVPKADDVDRQLDCFQRWHKIIDNNCSFKDLDYQMELLAEELLSD